MTFEERLAARAAVMEADRRERDREARAAGQVWWRGWGWWDAVLLIAGRRVYVRRYRSLEGADCESVAVASLDGRRRLALWLARGAWTVGYVVRGSRKELSFPDVSLEQLLGEVEAVHG